MFQAKDLPTFKDNDFLNEGQKLHVGEESKKNFLEKLKRDVEVENPGGWLLFWLCLITECSLCTEVSSGQKAHRCGQDFTLG